MSEHTALGGILNGVAIGLVWGWVGFKYDVSVTIITIMAVLLIFASYLCDVALTNNE